VAHFAEIDKEGNVLRVVVIGDDDCLDENGDESENVGKAFCAEHIDSTNDWVQCSYNTQRGVHIQGGTPLRWHYPTTNMVYDSTRDAFIGRQPFPSWTFNESTYEWEPPDPFPDDFKTGNYLWDEETKTWVKE